MCFLSIRLFNQSNEICSVLLTVRNGDGFLTWSPSLQVTGGLSSFSQATHSAAGAVVSKPREIASLIRHKFGSADNISALKDSLDETQGDEGVGPGGTRALGTGQLQSSPKYGSDEDCSSATSGSAGANSTTGAPGGPPSSKGNTLDHAQASGFDAILHEIQELRDNQGRLEESFENLKAHYQRDYTMIMEALQEERYRYHIIPSAVQYSRSVCMVRKKKSYLWFFFLLFCRCERLEEQLNDLTELHQNEILNLKQELASMEEKIAYQSYERARDIQVSFTKFLWMFLRRHQIYFTDSFVSDL